MERARGLLFLLQRLGGIRGRGGGRSLGRGRGGLGGCRRRGDGLEDEFGAGRLERTLRQRFEPRGHGRTFGRRGGRLDRRRDRGLDGRDGFHGGGRRDGGRFWRGRGFGEGSFRGRFGRGGRLRRFRGGGGLAAAAGFLLGERLAGAGGGGGERLGFPRHGRRQGFLGGLALGLERAVHGRLVVRHLDGGARLESAAERGDIGVVEDVDEGVDLDLEGFRLADQVAIGSLELPG